MKNMRFLLLPKSQKTLGGGKSEKLDQVPCFPFAGCKPRSKLPVKIGHGGTLDKSASGVLVIGLGHGTKRLESMLRGNKVFNSTE